MASNTLFQVNEFGDEWPAWHASKQLDAHKSHTVSPDTVRLVYMNWLLWVRNGGTEPQFLLKFCVWHGEVYLPSWLWQSTSRGADLMIREGKHSISWSQDLRSTQLQKYSHQCLQYKEPIKSPSILIYLIQFWLLRCYWLLLFESPSSAMPPRNRARYHKGLRCAWLHRAQAMRLTWSLVD